MPPAIRPSTGGEAMHAGSRGLVQPADDDVASGRSEQEGVQRSLAGHEATGRSSGSRGFRARPPPGTPPLLAHATSASLTAEIRLASARRGALRHGPGSARTLTLQIQTGQEPTSTAISACSSSRTRALPLRPGWYRGPYAAWTWPGRPACAPGPGARPTSCRAQPAPRFPYRYLRSGSSGMSRQGIQLYPSPSRRTRLLQGGR